MSDEDKIIQNLKAIRTVVDTDTSGADIESVVELGKKLASLCGLSAQCKAGAQKRLQAARLKALRELQDSGLQASILLKMVEAHCGDEMALFDYADRLNAAISHQLDYFRTVISLYKSELENSLKA